MKYSREKALQIRINTHAKYKRYYFKTTQTNHKRQSDHIP